MRNSDVTRMRVSKWRAAKEVKESLEKEIQRERKLRERKFRRRRMEEDQELKQVDPKKISHCYLLLKELRDQEREGGKGKGGGGLEKAGEENLLV